MKQGTQISGEKTGKGREIDTKTFHHVGHEERREQGKERRRAGGNRERTQRKGETRSGRERRDTPKGRHVSKARGSESEKRARSIMESETRASPFIRKSLALNTKFLD